jgi:hypothetical protein
MRATSVCPHITKEHWTASLDVDENTENSDAVDVLCDVYISVVYMDYSE